MLQAKGTKNGAKTVDPKKTKVGTPPRAGVIPRGGVIQLSTARLRKAAEHESRSRSERPSTSSRPATQEAVQKPRTSAIKTYDIIFSKREYIAIATGWTIIVFTLGLLVGEKL